MSIRDRCRRMKPGDVMAVCPIQFSREFHAGLFHGPRDSEEAFMEAMIGSAYGAWALRYDHNKDRYLIRRQWAEPVDGPRPDVTR